MPRKTISAFVIFTFLATAVPVPGRAGEVLLPAPGARMAVSPAFMPPMILGLTVDAADPMKFNFLIDQGDQKVPAQDQEQEFKRLIKYFLASLTIPEKDLWVNLSPYEGQRIIPQAFGQTEMGRDLLGQDYVLKQITASLIYPESELGKKFWADVYKKAHEQYGTTNIPVNTFNKVWIVPDEAMVYEHDGSAFVVKSHLKVMLEEDYLSLKNNSASVKFGTDKMQSADVQKLSNVSSQVVRDIVLPALEKEVNEGRNFALLRQINNALILATWYKRALKEGLLGQFYVDKAKVKGVDHADAQANQKIYQRYLQAFKKGVYNYIKEEADPYTHQTIPRKYFSGGFEGKDYSMVVKTTRKITDIPARVLRAFRQLFRRASDKGNLVEVAVRAQEPQTAEEAIAWAEMQALTNEETQQLKDFTPSFRAALASRWNRISDLMGQQQLTSEHITEIIQLINEMARQIQMSVKPYQFQKIGVDFYAIEKLLLKAQYIDGWGNVLRFNDKLDGDTSKAIQALGYGEDKIQGIERILLETKTMKEALAPAVRYLLFTLKMGDAKTQGGRTVVVEYDVINRVLLIQTYVGLLIGEDGQVIGGEDYKRYRDELQSEFHKASTTMTKVMGFLSNIEQATRVYSVTLDNGTRAIDPTQFGDAAMTVREREVSDSARQYMLDLRKHLLASWVKIQRVLADGSDVKAIEIEIDQLTNLAQEMRDKEDNDPVIRAAFRSLSLGGTAIRERPGSVSYDYDLARALNAANGRMDHVLDFLLKLGHAQTVQLWHGVNDGAEFIDTTDPGFNAVVTAFRTDDVFSLEDEAMTAREMMKVPAKTPGGIDLNPANLNLRIKRDGKGVPLPMGQQDMGQLNNIEGLMPVIIKIVPATHIPALSALIGEGQNALATVN